MSRFFPLKVSSIKKETIDSVSIAFDLSDQKIKEQFKFKSGQYLTVKTDLNGEELRRSYSICSAPHENSLRIGVKKVEGGKFSTYANEVLKEGDVLDVMIPMGGFTVDVKPSNDNKYCFFASGSGITPIISIIKDILQNEPNSDIVLFYGNKKTDTILFKDEILALKDVYTDKFAVYNILSKEHIGNDLFRGRIDVDKCEAFSKYFVDIHKIDLFFICGPFHMIMDVKDWLINKNINKEQVRFELFGAPPKKDVNKDIVVEAVNSSSFEDGTSEITFVKDDDRMTFEYANTSDMILDVAMDKGLDIPYSCKGGVCCTCKAKVIKGEVEMILNYALEDEEVADGYILTCQAIPKSEKVVLSFDD